MFRLRAALAFADSKFAREAEHRWANEILPTISSSRFFSLDIENSTRKILSKAENSCAAGFHSWVKNGRKGGRSTVKNSDDSSRFSRNPKFL